MIVTILTNRMLSLDHKDSKKIEDSKLVDFMITTILTNRMLSFGHKDLKIRKDSKAKKCLHFKDPEQRSILSHGF